MLEHRIIRAVLRADIENLAYHLHPPKELLDMKPSVSQNHVIGGEDGRIKPGMSNLAGESKKANPSESYLYVYDSGLLAAGLVVASLNPYGGYYALRENATP